MPKAVTLIHGGVMVNYQCSAACRHCLYGCSPVRSPGYVNEEATEKICRLLRKGGCRSVHIGGGEPFLDFDGLVMMIQKLKQAGIRVEYIETNASWINDNDDTKESLEQLKHLLASGGNALCISVDPFHAEYVPYGAPLTLAKLCEKAGMDYFIWKSEFLPDLSCLDSGSAHSRSDMEKALSKKYIYNTARLYGIGYGGRAVNIEREYFAPQLLKNITAGSTPCRNLLSSGHFHVDMFCNFIPPRCTGICIPLAEAVEGIPEGKYPAFDALYSGGVSALLRLAEQYGFLPEDYGYPSKCNLCFHLRHFLTGLEFPDGNAFPELDGDHYRESLKYY